MGKKRSESVTAPPAKKAKIDIDAFPRRKVEAVEEKASLVKAGKKSNDIKKKKVDHIKAAENRKVLKEEEEVIAREGEDAKEIVDDDKKKSEINVITTGNLQEGDLLLAAVRDIYPSELVLNLPYGISGIVKKEHCVDIPDFQRLGLIDSLPADLRQFKLMDNYKVGQIVTICVININKKTNKKHKGKFSIVECSLRPSLINAGFEKKNLVKNMSLPCSILKIDEEHTVTCSLAIKNTQGVLQKKGLPTVCVGQIIQPHLNQVHTDSGVCGLKLIGTMKPIDIKQDLPITSLKPGMLLQGKVQKLIFDKKFNDNKKPRGYNLNICGTLEGMLHNDYSNSELTKKQLTEVRILAVTHDQDRKVKIQLSSLSHLLELSIETQWKKDYFVGQEFNGSIVDVQPRIVKIQNHEDVTATCHVTRLSDNKVSDIQSFTNVGDEAKARIIAFNYLEKMVMVGMNESFVEESVVSYNNLTIGEVIMANIVEKKEDRLVVKLSPYVNGIIDLHQLTDIPLKEIPNKYKEGNKIKVRVWQIFPHKKLVKCTAKKSLMKCEESNIITQFSDVKINQIIDCTFYQNFDYGGICKFFGKMSGLIGCHDDNRETLKDLIPGQILRVRVCKIDEEKQQIRLTLDLEIKVFTMKTKELKAGKCIEKIMPLEKTEKGIYCKFFIEKIGGSFSEAKGFVPKEHLHDDLQESENIFKSIELNKTFKEQQILQQAFIISCKGHCHTNTKEMMTIISLKQSQILSGEEFITNFSQIQQGKYYFGYVKEVTDKCVFVSINEWNQTGICV